MIHWYRVEIKDFSRLDRPMSQGTTWFLARLMRVLEAV